MQDHSGSILGGFLLKKTLGSGGMGSVYLAEDTSLKRPVAVKLLAANLASDPIFVERFLREARSIAAIRHPNLMHIYTVGEDTGTHFFVMEYIEGKTLGQILGARKQPLNLSSALRVIEQIMDALKKVHEAGIIHRDLKPGNIMIDSDQRAILVDFGLSKDTTDEGLTQSGMILGTPDYMAPEQIEAAPVDTCTDIYALGIILYEMLTGRTPFHQRSAIMTMRSHCEDPIPSVLEKRPELPPEVELVLQKMLTKDPQKRIASIEELAANLLSLHRSATLKRLAGGFLKTETLQSTMTVHANTDAAAIKASSHKNTGANRPPLPQPDSPNKNNRLLLAAAGVIILLLVWLILKPKPAANQPTQNQTTPSTDLPVATDPIVETKPEEPDASDLSQPDDSSVTNNLPTKTPTNQLPKLAEGETALLNHSHLDPEGKQRQIRIVKSADGSLRIDIAVEGKGTISAPIRKNTDGLLILKNPLQLDLKRRKLVANMLRIINRQFLGNNRP